MSLFTFKLELMNRVSKWVLFFHGFGGTDKRERGCAFWLKVAYLSELFEVCGDSFDYDNVLGFRHMALGQGRLVA